MGAILDTIQDQETPPTEPAAKAPDTENCKPKHDNTQKLPIKAPKGDNEDYKEALDEVKELRSKLQREKTINGRKIKRKDHEIEKWKRKFDNRERCCCYLEDQVKGRKRKLNEYESTERKKKRDEESEVKKLEEEEDMKRKVRIKEEEKLRFHHEGAYANY